MLKKKHLRLQSHNYKTANVFSSVYVSVALSFFSYFLCERKQRICSMKPSDYLIFVCVRFK